MSILLTGATGYIGSSVLAALVAKGHDVQALVRSDEKAASVLAQGAHAVVGNITDLDLVASLVAASDGVIHTASPGDASSAAVDGAFVDVVLRELAGTEKPFVHTGGIWIFGTGDDLVEDGPRQALPLTGWRVPVEKRVRESAVRTTIVAPAVVYGHGKGLPTLLAAEGEVRLVGDGSQHWTTVHVDDVADLYLLAFEAGAADEYYIAASGQNPTVRELGEASSAGHSVIAETPDESRARLGGDFADALLLDQQAFSKHARQQLGWQPSRVPLVDDLRSGTYAG